MDQKQMYDRARQTTTRRYHAFMEIQSSGNPITRNDFDKLVARWPERWEIFRHYFYEGDSK